MKRLGLNDPYFLGRKALNLTTSIFITSALFASVLIVSAWSSFCLIHSALKAALLTVKLHICKVLKSLLLLVTMN